MRGKRVAEMTLGERQAYEREKERRRNNPEYKARERERDRARHRGGRKKSPDTLAKHAENQRWKRVYELYHKVCDQRGAVLVNAALTQRCADAMMMAQGTTDRGDDDHDPQA